MSSYSTPSGNKQPYSFSNSLFFIKLLSVIRITALVIVLSASSLSAAENIKNEFLRVVRDEIVKTHRQGLSSKYFSIANPEKFISGVDAYIKGVAVDPDYLAHFKIGNYMKSFFWVQHPGRGLTQPRYADAGWGDLALTPKEQKYSGWIILAEPPDAHTESRKAAFHEAIHAYHLYIGSGADSDKYRAPESISNQFSNLLFNLGTLDNNIIQIQRKIKNDHEVITEINKVNKKIEYLENKYNEFANDKFTEVLNNIGGSADWGGYRVAVNNIARAAEYKKEIEDLKNKLSELEKLIDEFAKFRAKYEEQELVLKLHISSAQVVDMDKLRNKLQELERDIIPPIQIIAEKREQLVRTTKNLESNTSRLKLNSNNYNDLIQGLYESTRSVCDYASRASARPFPSDDRFQFWIQQSEKLIQETHNPLQNLENEITSQRVSMSQNIDTLENEMASFESAVSRIRSMTLPDPELADKLKRDLDNREKDLKRALEIQPELEKSLVELGVKYYIIEGKINHILKKAKALKQNLRDADKQLLTEVNSIRNSAENAKANLGKIPYMTPKVPKLEHDFDEIRTAIKNLGTESISEGLVKKSETVISEGNKAISAAEAAIASVSSASANISGTKKKANECLASLKKSREEASKSNQKMYTDTENAINSCDYKKAESLISQMPLGTDKASLEQKYNSSKELENNLRQMIKKANGDYKAGDYVPALSTLKSALGKAECDKHKKSINEKITKVERIIQKIHTDAISAIKSCDYELVKKRLGQMPEGVEKKDIQRRYRTSVDLENSLKKLVRNANDHYKKGDYKIALSTLESALGQAECERHKKSINEKIAKVKSRMGEDNGDYGNVKRVILSCDFKKAKILLDELPESTKKSELNELYLNSVKLKNRLEKMVIKAKVRYKDGDYELALATLESALGESECSKHKKKLGDMIAKVKTKMNGSDPEDEETEDGDVNAEIVENWEIIELDRYCDKSGIKFGNYPEADVYWGLYRKLVNTNYSTKSLMTMGINTDKHYIYVITDHSKQGRERAARNNRKQPHELFKGDKELVALTETREEIERIFHMHCNMSLIDKSRKRVEDLFRKYLNQFKQTAAGIGGMSESELKIKGQEMFIRDINSGKVRINLFKNGVLVDRARLE